MKKRGIGHIEIIISFLLFITAVGFGLYFFNTGDSGRLVDSSLTYAFREIEQNTSTTIEVYSVNVSGTAISGDELALKFEGVDGRTSVEDYEGNHLNSSRQDTDPRLVYVSSSNWASENFIFVMFGEEFEEEILSKSAAHNASYYKIGSSEIRNLISERKFNVLKDVYYEDYDGLKSQSNFNIPDRVDFGFSLVFDDGTKIEAVNAVPEGFEIFSDSKRVSVLRSDDSIVFADLVVKVW